MFIVLICFALSVLFFSLAIHRSGAQARKEERENVSRMTAEAEERHRRQAAQAAHQAAAEAKRREASEKRRAREETAAQAHALKVARAAELAELAERRLRAEQALRDLHAQKPAQTATTAHTAAPARQHADPMNTAPQAFSGEIVAFTGTLPTMTRAEAISATQARSGKAYTRITAGCTLLVIGEKPGRVQLDQAAAWGVKTITWQEWFARAEISWRRRMVARSMMAAGSRA